MKEIPINIAIALSEELDAKERKDYFYSCNVLADYRFLKPYVLLMDGCGTSIIHVPYEVSSVVDGESMRRFLDQIIPADKKIHPFVDGFEDLVKDMQFCGKTYYQGDIPRNNDC